MVSIIEYIKEKFFRAEDRCDFIIKNSRSQFNSTTIVFYKTYVPIFVTKIRKDENKALSDEYNNLLKLESIISNVRLKNTIEHSLFYGNIDSEWFLIKKYLPGINGRKFLHESRLNERKFVDLSLDWLIAFTKDTSAYHVNNKAIKDKEVKKIVDFDIAPPYINDIVSNDHIFFGPTHSDYLPQNILIRSNKITGVIDFEQFEMNGIPIADLVGIFVSIATEKYGYTDKAIQYIFSDRIMKMIDGAFNKFSKAFGIPKEEIAQVVPIYSDRAIFISKMHHLEDLIQFHLKLKDYFLAKYQKK